MMMNGSDKNYYYSFDTFSNFNFNTYYIKLIFLFIKYFGKNKQYKY